MNTASLDFSLNPSTKKKITDEPLAKRRFSLKIKAWDKFYRRHKGNIPRIKFCA
jgi:hypothetical protein